MRTNQRNITKNPSISLKFDRWLQHLRNFKVFCAIHYSMYSAGIYTVVHPYYTQPHTILKIPKFVTDGPTSGYDVTPTTNGLLHSN